MKSVEAFGSIYPAYLRDDVVELQEGNVTITAGELVEVLTDGVETVGAVVAETFETIPFHLQALTPTFFSDLALGKNFDDVAKSHAAQLGVRLGVDGLIRLFNNLTEEEASGLLEGLDDGYIGRHPFFESEAGQALEGAFINLGVTAALHGSQLDAGDYAKIAANETVKFAITQVLQTQSWAVSGGVVSSSVFDAFNGAGAAVSPDFIGPVQPVTLGAPGVAAVAAAITLFSGLLDNGFDNFEDTLASAAIAGATAYVSTVVGGIVAGAIGGAAASGASAGLAVALGFAAPGIGHIIGALAGAALSKLLTSALYGPPPLIDVERHDDGSVTIRVTGVEGGVITGGTVNDDEIYGHDGADNLAGHAGNDSIYGGEGADQLYGGNENDLVIGGEGSDSIDTGGQHDSAFGGRDGDLIDGGGGNDLLIGGDGSDEIYGDNKNDFEEVDGHNARASKAVVGEEYDPDAEEPSDDDSDDTDDEETEDDVTGNQGADEGETHADLIFGGAGNDRIYAGEGGDFASGGYGDDIVLGQEGDDAVEGGGHNDHVAGGDGDDFVEGGAGADNVYGGDGGDTLIGDKVLSRVASDLTAEIDHWLSQRAGLGNNIELRELLGLQRDYEQATDLDARPHYEDANGDLQSFDEGAALTLGEVLLTKLPNVESSIASYRSELRSAHSDNLADALSAASNALAADLAPEQELGMRFLRYLADGAEGSERQDLFRRIFEGEFKYIEDDASAPHTIAGNQLDGSELGQIPDFVFGAEADLPVGAELSEEAYFALRDVLNVARGAIGGGPETYVAEKARKAFVPDENRSETEVQADLLVAISDAVDAFRASTASEITASDVSAIEAILTQVPDDRDDVSEAQFDAIAKLVQKSTPFLVSDALRELPSIVISDELQAGLERHIVFSEEEITALETILVEASGYLGASVLHYAREAEIEKDDSASDEEIDERAADYLESAITPEELGLIEEVLSYRVSGNAVSRAAIAKLLNKAEAHFVQANPATTQISLGAGDDRLFGGDGEDILYGGLGNDLAKGGSESDLIYGDEPDQPNLDAAGSDAPSVDETVQPEAALIEGGDDTLSGESGDDTIFGGAGDNEIYGGAGRDQLITKEGADTLDGGEDADLIDSGAGDDVIYGGSELEVVSFEGLSPQDRLARFTGHADTLYAGGGDDTIVGDGSSASLNSNDSIMAGEEDDTVVDVGLSLALHNVDFIFAGDGDDLSYGQQGDDRINGEAGADELYGGTQNDFVAGDEGDDTILGDSGDDALFGGAGADRAYGGDGNDAISGDLEYDGSTSVIPSSGASDGETNPWNDTLEGGAGSDTINGDFGNDEVYGGLGNDELSGSVGNDVLGSDSETGNDTIDGGSGSDTIIAADGDDYSIGGAGDDRISSGAGDDTVFGDEDPNDSGFATSDTPGNDEIYGGTGNDLIIGGGGDDTIDAGSGDDAVGDDDGADIVHLGDGADSFTSSVTDQQGDEVYGGDGDDTIIAGAGDDTLKGGAGSDSINAGDGDDLISAFIGDDTINAGDGDDVISLGRGVFEVEGGFGDDLYVIDLIAHQSIISDAGGSNELRFDVNIRPKDIEMEIEGADLLIFSKVDPDASVRIVGQVSDTPVIERISFADTDIGTLEIEQDGDEYVLRVKGSPDDLLRIPAGLADDPVIKSLAYPDDDFVVDFKQAIYGTDGSDVLNGNEHGQPVFAGAGDDLVQGLDGKDFIEGGEGDDTLYGGNDDDVVNGGAGDDSVFGDNGRDSIDGGAGDDTLIGGGGNDEFLINQNLGDHDVIEDFDTALEVVSLKSFSDRFATFEQLSYLRATFDERDGGVEIAFKADSSDAELKDFDLSALATQQTVFIKDVTAADLSPDKFKFALRTVDLADRSTADSEFNINEHIIGTLGDDTIRSSEGLDVFTGGEGSDRFVIASHGAGDSTTVNQITDFNAAEDLLDLSRFSEFSSIEQFVLREFEEDLVVSFNSGQHLVLEDVSREEFTVENVIFDHRDDDHSTEYYSGTRSAIEDETNIAEGGAAIAGIEASAALEAEIVAAEANLGSENDPGSSEQAGNNLSAFGVSSGNVGAGEITSDAGWNGAGLNSRYHIVHQGPETTVEVLESYHGLNYNNNPVADGGVLGPDYHQLDFVEGTDIGEIGSIIYSGHEEDTVVDEWIYGGNDVLRGGDWSEAIHGKSGKDNLYAGAGSDSVFGGDGNDFIEGFTGADSIGGGIGDDEISAGDQSDTVSGGDGADVIFGGDGNDFLEGNHGADDISGGEGADTIKGGIDTDVIRGGDGEDLVYGGGARDAIYGNDGKDKIYGELANDLIYGGGSADLIVGGDDADHVYGGRGADTLRGDDVETSDEDGADVVAGGRGADVLYGGGGNDDLYGDHSNDAIYGTDFDERRPQDADGFVADNAEASGADTIWAGEGHDRLTGGGGGDQLFGEGGDDNASGEAGEDEIAGGSGNDVLSGGLGHDTLSGDAGSDLVQGGEGRDKLYGGDGDDRLEGGTEADLLLGDDGNDSAFGGDGDDTILGGAGHDRTEGGEGNDSLEGNVGDDALFGGFGRDTAYGGDGNDTVVLGDGDDLGKGGLGADFLSGEGGNDRLEGEDGDDLLDGGDGDDSLHAGTGDDVVIGGLGNDYIAGGEGRDAIDAGDGQNYVHGGGGADTIVGGSENDELHGGGGGDLIDGGQGSDLIVGGADADRLSGGDGDDYLQGGDDDDTLVGQAGLDLIEGGTGNDDISGGDGKDFLRGNDGADTILGGAGNDRSYGGEGDDELSGEAGADQVFGGDGIDTLTGGDGNDLLNGGTGNDTLSGDDGSDVIIGGDGHDLAYGGLGDDLLVDRASIASDDQAYGGAGSDTLRTGLGNDTLDGGLGDDELFGGGDDDTLTAAIGADRLFGGDGNDTYYVDDALVTAFEFGNEGDDDHVISSVSFEIGENFERLTLIGLDDVNGTGSELDNEITGNVGANTIIGMMGWDTLRGLAGNDVIEGRTGNDSLIGGAGNDELYGGANQDTLIAGIGVDQLYGGGGDDTYYIDDDFDSATESQSEGTDHVIASVSYDLGENFENLTLTSLDDLNGNGNELANDIEGNDGANHIIAFEGWDIVHSGAGNDTLEGRSGNDSLVGGSGDDEIYGGANDDTLIAGSGVDTLIGGGGDDTYYVDSALDSTTESFEEGIDHIIASISFSLGENFEHLTLDGASNVDGHGNSLNNRIIGNSGRNQLSGLSGDDTIEGGEGDDTLIAGQGADILRGGLGDDLYIVVEAPVLTEELDAEGIDLVEASIDFTLSANFENLTLVGGASLSGVGNDLANILRGNDGDNNLSGLQGDDTLSGGLGADHLDGGDGIDEVSYLNAQTGVRVELADASLNADWTHASEAAGDTYVSIENLVGSLFDDQLGGDESANRIDGAAGDDELLGNGGDDILIGGLGADLLNGGAGFDTASYAAATSGVYANLEDATENASIASEASGDSYTSIEALIGSQFGDTLKGNGANSLIEGGNGGDLLHGSGDLGDYSSDTLIGGTGDDTFDGGYGNDFYHYTLGDGSDLISEFNNSSHGLIDRLVILEALAEDVTFSHGADFDLIMSFADGGSITVDSHFESGHWDLEEIEFSVAETLNSSGIIAKTIADSATDGNDFIRGSDFIANTLYGNAGDDTLVGGYGNDTYLYSLGDGHDLIDEFNNQSRGSVDRLLLSDFDVNDVTFAHGADNDLVITFADGGTVTVNDHFESAHRDLERIEFAGGVMLSYGDITARMVADSATAGDDLIRGSAFADDTLYGAAGDDTLDGGHGADTYVYRLGDGHDVVDEFTNYSHGLQDRLIFEDAFADQVRFSRNDGGDLIASFAVDGSVTVVDHFDSLHEAIELVEFADGAILNKSQILDRINTDRIFFDVDDTLHGGNGDDNIIGGGGDDHIFGGDGDDTIDGGTGADTLNGGLGNDQYLAGDGDDLLIGDVGQNSYLGGAGEDTLDLSALTGDLVVDLETDVLSSSASSEGGSISDIEHLISGSGNDSIHGSTIENEIHGGSGSDTIRASGGDDSIFGGGGVDSLDGGEGFDVARYETSSAAITVSLFDTVQIEGVTTSDVFTSIEGVFGSAFDDTISGDDNQNTLWGSLGADQILAAGGDDVIYGGDGDDSLTGGLGADTLEGGDGIDQVSYSQALEGLVVSLEDASFNTGDADGDEFIAIENVFGTSFADTLTGDSGANALWGSAGADEIFGGLGGDMLYGGDDDDTLAGGDGADTIDGGSGVDLVIFDNAVEAVDVDLLTGGGHSGQADGDVYFSIENVIGSAHDDTIEGSDSANEINGADGADTLVGHGGDDSIYGGAGDDLLDGGEGFDVLEGGDGVDTARYALAAVGVNVSLANDAASSGGADIDEHHSIENVLGGSFADVISGSEVANELNGEAGADALMGRSGDDTLIGGTGADTLDGGVGSDTFIFNAGDGSDVISDTSDSSVDVDRLVLANVASSSAQVGAADDADDLLLNLSDGTSLTLQDLRTDGGLGIEHIEFVDGVVWQRADIIQQYEEQLQSLFVFGEVSGTTGADTFLAGPLDARLLLNRGQDIVSLHDTIGDIRIHDWGRYSSDDDDRLIFADGTTIDDLITSRVDVANDNSTTDLKIEFVDRGGSITIEEAFSWNSNWHERQIDFFEFSDGTVFSHEQFYAQTIFKGTDGNDSIYARYGNDTFTLGLGTDHISMGSDRDVVIMSDEIGDTRLFDRGRYSNDDDDRLIFAGGLTIDDLITSRIDANGNGEVTDLKIEFADRSGSISIEEAFTWDSDWHERQIDFFEFSDGTVLSHEQFYAQTIFKGTDGNDSIYNGYGNDTFTLGLGTDRIQMGRDRDVVIMSDVIGDTRLFDRGRYSNDDDDRLIFAGGLTVDDLITSRIDATGNGEFTDLKIEFADRSGSISIEEAFTWDSDWHERQIDFFEFSDGTVLNHEQFYAATIFKGTDGNDSIYNGYGNDTYTLSLGTDRIQTGRDRDTIVMTDEIGDTRIKDWGRYSNDDDDRLKFADGVTIETITTSLVDVDGDGNSRDIRIEFNDREGSITLEGVMEDQSWWHERQIDLFEFADGTVMSHEQFFAATYLKGTSGNDYIWGSRGNDTFTLGEGDDYVRLGRGTDHLYMGEEAGTWSIADWGTSSSDKNDTFHFASGITQADLIVERGDYDGDGKDGMRISFTNHDGVAIIEDMFVDTYRRVEWYEFEDGTRLAYHQIDDLIT